MGVERNEGQENLDIKQGDTLVSSQPVYTQPEMGNTAGSMYEPFGGLGTGFLTTNLGSEYTQKIVEGITKLYKDTGKTNVRVVPLDRDIITQLAYSSVVVAAASELEVYYYPILLADTGKPAMTARDYFIQVSEAAKNRQPSNATVPSDAIDKIYNDIVISKLVEIHGKEKKYIPLDGLVVDNGATINDMSIKELGTRAFNAIHAEFLSRTGQQTAVIGKILQACSGFRLQTNGCRQNVPAMTTLGKPIRSDFAINMVPILKKATTQSLNIGGGNETLFTIMGYVDAIPRQVEVREFNSVYQAVRFRPNIVITNISSNYESVNMGMLAIANAAVMMQPTLWLAAVSPRDKKNPGVLNLIANLSNKEGGVGDKIDLNGKAFTNDQVIDILRKMYSDAPALSIDVEEFGSSSSFLGILGAAAQTKNPQLRRNALNEIIRVVHELTGGAFDSRFNPEEIIAGYTEVPTGKWVSNKDGMTRDIRDIDLEFVLEQAGNNPEIVKKWISSENNPALSYMLKTEVIAHIAGDAVITGRAMRIVMHPAFLTALVNATTAAGLKPQYTPEVELQDQMGFFVTGSPYDIVGANVNFGVAYNPNSGYGYENAYTRFSGPMGARY